MTASPANARFRWPACTAPMHRAPRFARCTASFRPQTASCCTPRICASAAAIASTPVLSAPRNTPRLVISDRAARWTSAPIAPAAGGGLPRSRIRKYGSNRLAQGKLPLCAEMCSTKSLLAGDGDDHRRNLQGAREKRGYGSGAWGWTTAYHEGIASEPPWRVGRRHAPGRMNDEASCPYCSIIIVALTILTSVCHRCSQVLGPDGAPDPAASVATSNSCCSSRPGSRVGSPIPMRGRVFSFNLPGGDGIIFTKSRFIGWARS